MNKSCSVFCSYWVSCRSKQGEQKQTLDKPAIA